jgi:purine-nucleoside phosphorylase
MPTPHIAAEPGEFAESVLLPGDPLRAKYIAENFLDDAHQVTDIRNMYGFTGGFEGEAVSVMGTGMGIPSASIYATELIDHYGVRRLIRVGSCGGIAPDLELRDVIVAIGASTDSKVNRARYGGWDFAAVADFGLARAAVDAADEMGIPTRVGAVHTVDLFYNPVGHAFDTMEAMGALAVEMEAAGLYGVAAERRARALAILTVSDHVRTGASTDPEERERGFDDMVRVALRTLQIDAGSVR